MTLGGARPCSIRRDNAEAVERGEASRNSRSLGRPQPCSALLLGSESFFPRALGEIWLAGFGLLSTFVIGASRVELMHSRRSVHLLAPTLFVTLPVASRKSMRAAPSESTTSRSRGLPFGSDRLSTADFD
jgi:hypothetical protein